MSEFAITGLMLTPCESEIIGNKVNIDFRKELGMLLKLDYLGKDPQFPPENSFSLLVFKSHASLLTHWNMVMISDC